MSDPKVYRATLRDLCTWFDEEGLSHDEPIIFATGPSTHVLVASVYPDDSGKPVVDLEDEEL